MGSHIPGLDTGSRRFAWSRIPLGSVSVNLWWTVGGTATCAAARRPWSCKEESLQVSNQPRCPSDLSLSGTREYWTLPRDKGREETRTNQVQNQFLMPDESALCTITWALEDPVNITWSQGFVSKWMMSAHFTHCNYTTMIHMLLWLILMSNYFLIVFHFNC